MRVLVAYATRSGATAGIAERIAERLHAAGHDAVAESVTTAAGAAAYDAYVIGSAVYLGRWQKEAVEFVTRNRTVLGNRPTWLFSSGPLGAEPTALGLDQREAAVNPKELGALREVTHPRDHHVFYGALNPDRLGIGPRLMRMTPAGRKLLEEGDFRNWAEIDAWADHIAAEIAQNTEPAVVGG